MGDRLRGKVAIVTGGATGIGEAISKRFATEGAKVLVVGREDDPVQAVCDEISALGGESLPYQADVAREDAAAATVRFAVERFGRLDVLINNAGVFPQAAELDEYTVENFERLIHGNVRTTFHMTRAALPELKKTRGCIVAAASEAAIIGEPMITPYAGTKGFIEAFIRTVAIEQAKYGIRANTVAPGPIATEMTQPEVGPIDESFLQDARDANPMGRRGSPEEVANVYLFLASDEASYVTGANYSVDGGSTKAHGNLGQQVPEEMRQPPTPRIDLKHQYEGRASVR